jgi:hypothetical protein
MTQPLGSKTYETTVIAFIAANERDDQAPIKPHVMVKGNSAEEVDHIDSGAVQVAAA